MYRVLLTAITGVWLLLAACNKDTNQLPAVPAPPATISIPVRLNNIRVADVVVAQTVTAASDTVWAWIRNNTGVKMTNVKVLVEFCNAVPQNYDNCTMQTILNVSELRANDSAGKVLLYVNHGIKLDSTLINAGILFRDGDTNVFAGVKGDAENIAVFAQKTSDTSTFNYTYADVNGYVFADGKATFRLKWQEDKYYNFIGSIQADKSFNCRLYNNKSLVAPLVSAPITHDTLQDVVKFTNFKNTPLDTFSSISFTLKAVR